MTDSSGAAGPFSAPPEQAQSTEELAQLVDPFKGFRVDELTLSGVPEGLNGDEIRSGLVLAGTQGIFSREKPQLYASVLREDIDRVRLFLARQGYPRSQVVVRVDKHGDREARVRLRVSAGEPVRIVGIEIEGIDASQTAELRDRIPLERGRRVIDAEVRGASEDIRGWLEEQGHARAQVETYLLPRSTNEVAVRFAATPGPVYFVDQVRIVGTHEDLEPLARKTAGIEPGSRYSPKAIAQAHDQLRLLDLFRQIRIRPVFPDSSAQVDTTASARRTLDLEIEVSNISPRTLETGVGYWTDDFIRAHLAWKHRNLFGGGRGFRARGFYSLHSQDVTGGIWWPALIWPRTRGEIQNSLVRDSEESYRTYTERVDFSLLYRPTLKTNYRGGVRLSAVKLEKLTDDPEAFDESGGYATVFFGEALLDGADDRLNPSSGGIVSASAEVSVPQILSDTPYLKAQTSGTKYHRLIGTRLIGAAHVSAGWARPIGNAQDLLPTERFFAGGVNSMRGFKRRKLGPLDASGAPIGGEALLEGSVELRFPIWGKLVGALFTDTGQVWEKRTQVRLSDLEVAVGGGLGFRTPIGPVRADVGHRLTDIIPGQPMTVFHLAIGNPY